MDSKVKLLGLTVILCLADCKTDQNNHAIKTNKEFVLEMISQLKKLDDYPERISPELTVYEPSSLPFGGVYKGIEGFRQFYPKVKEFYDLDQLHVLNIYEDSNSVFVIISAVIAKTKESIRLCEQLTFDDDGRVKEVMLFIYDFENKPIHTILG